MRSIFPCVTLLAMLVLGSAAQATTRCYTTSDPELTLPAVGPGIGGVYVDNDVCQLDGCTFSLWIYQESNGIPGLQRDDPIHSDFAGCAQREAKPFLGIGTRYGYDDGAGNYVEPDFDIF
jgi:hypothetical protein